MPLDASHDRSALRSPAGNFGADALLQYDDRRLLCDGGHWRLIRAVRSSDGHAVLIRAFGPETTLRMRVQLNREFELACRLEVPHVLRYLTLQQYEDGPALIHQDTECVPLWQQLPRGGVNLSFFFAVARGAASALLALHRNRLLHDELSTRSILVHPTSLTTQLLHIGCGRSVFEQSTTSGALRGRIEYVAPERMGRTSQVVDERSDLYSLGIILYRLLSGRLPFDDADPLRLVHAQLALRPRPLHELRPLPGPICAVVHKLLAKDPDDRYASARGLIADLDECERGLADERRDTFPLGRSDSSERLKLPQRLYGRRKQLAELTAALKRCLHDSGELVFVHGPTGVGKSATVLHLQPLTIYSGGYFCIGKFEQLERDVPYYGILLAFKHLVHQILAQSDAQIAKWRAELQRRLGANCGLLTPLVPELELIVGPQATVPAPTPDEDRVRFLAAFESLVLALSACGPVVIFLDDLQWADKASIELIRRVAAGVDVRGILVVGAYRDNEVAQGSGLDSLLRHARRIRRARDLFLGPLGVEDASALLSDLFGSREEDTAELATLCIEKTQGNPFFLVQFLSSAYQDGLVWFEISQERWRWNAAKLKAMSVPDGVADLLIARLQRMDPEVLRILTLAACIGSHFDLRTLSIAADAPTSEVSAAIYRAVAEHLVAPVNTPVKLAPDGTPQNPSEEHTGFRFLHDRIQAVAYGLLPEPELKRVHGTIGTLLLARLPSSEREARVFELLHHLHAGPELSTVAERVMLAELNLRAAKRAKLANAYEQAGALLERAIAMTRADWTQHYALTLALHTDLAEVYYLARDVSGATRAVATVLFNARSPLDKTPAYETRLRLQMAQNEVAAAVDCAQEVLRLLGVRLPARPGPVSALMGLLRMRVQLNHLGLEHFQGLPEMSDDRVLCAMRILFTALTPVYLARPALLPAMVLEMIALTLKHGVCRQSAEAFVGYGIILLTVFDDLKGALAIGDLCLSLSARFEQRESRANVTSKYNLFFRHWKDNPRNTLPALREAYQIGLETGEIEAATLSAVSYVWYGLLTGVPLEDVHADVGRFNEVVRRYGQQRFVADLEMLQRVTAALMAGREDEPAAELLCERAEIERRTTLGDQSGVANASYSAALVYFVLGRYAQARELCALCGPNLQAVAATLYVPAFHFLSALSRLAPQPAQHARIARRELRAVHKSARRLRSWAARGVIGCAHKATLVEAELARIAGRELHAIGLYDQAVEGATSIGFLHEQAIACELAARFHRERERRTVAITYAQRARRAYAAWGATAKLDALDAEYLELPRASAPTPAPEPRDLDLLAVVKASQAISGELVYTELLKRLMDIVMQNAGAERAMLVLKRPSGLQIVAATDTGGELELQSEVAAEHAQRCSMPVLQFVVRTGRTVVLDDACHSGDFASDPYLRRNRTQSLLCMPITLKGTVGGALYLENNLTRGAFTMQRLDVLSVIAAQAGISIENSNLLMQLEQQAIARNNLFRFFPAGKVERILGDSESLGATETDVTAVFADISEFSAWSAELRPRELVALLNQYFPAMTDVVFRHDGVLEKYIGDALLAIWGAPFREPRDADNAVAAAVDMQRTVRLLNQRWPERRPLRVHIGINSGPVAAGNIGSKHYVQYATIGDTTNIASRICDAAQGGEIVISDSTRQRLMQAQWSLEPMGPTLVKGRSEPLELYRVRWSE